MMKENQSQNLENLSSRKLWSMLNTMLNNSQNVFCTNSAETRHAVERELIARKEYQASKQFHQPH
jgi:hypothetical protein